MRRATSLASREGFVLDEAGAKSVLEQLSELWRYGISLEEIDAASGRLLKMIRPPQNSRSVRVDRSTSSFGVVRSGMTSWRFIP